MPKEHVDTSALSLAEVDETAKLIAPYVRQTPVCTWRGGELAAILKLELLQHTGTFKLRGALSNMLRMSPEEKRRGVTAVSAGNHAIAVAHAAAILGVSAKVVMISTANPARVSAVRSRGAEVVMVDGVAAAFAEVDRIAREEGRVFVHPFEGRNVALGTATLGLEFAKQAGPLDALIVAIGGGGLAAGVAWAFKALQPGCHIYGVEPEGADTMHRSFAANAPQSIAAVKTIADSLGPATALPYSFSLCRANVDELCMVDDDQLCRAMSLMFRDMKLAVEPAGAAALAALVGPLRGRLQDKRVGVVVCGSNIDIDTFAALVRRGEALPFEKEPTDALIQRSREVLS